jgi:hypothetical protein
MIDEELAFTKNAERTDKVGSLLASSGKPKYTDVSSNDIQGKHWSLDIIT